MWQEVDGDRQFGHWWQYVTGHILAAMTTYLTLLALAGALVWVLERTHRRAFDSLPRAPFGADREADADLVRIRRELEIRRQEEPTSIRAAAAGMQPCPRSVRQVGHRFG